MMVSVLAFWMVAMLLPTSASAQFRLRIEDLVSGQGVVVTDWNGVPAFDSDGNLIVQGDQNNQPGLISVMLFNLGPVSVSLTTGQTKPVGTSATGAVGEMKLTSVTMQTSGPASLRLTLEDTGYPFDGSSNLQVNSQVLNLAFVSPGGGTLDSQAWVNTDPSATGVPALGAEQSSIGLLDPIGNDAAKATGYVATAPQLNTLSASIGGVSGALLYGEGSSAVFAASGPFSLFTQVVLNITGDTGGSLSFDQATTVLATSALVLPPGDPSPEPGSLLLIATGIIGVGGKMRRRLFARG
jgi:hypothetical protein